MQGKLLSLGLQIEKYDDEQRVVYGIATSEKPDKQGDIVDYDATCRAIKDWPGNVREQHDAKKPIGKAIDIQPLDDERKVRVGVYVSKSPEGEAAWTKVKEGILKYMSIKGEILSQRPEIVKSGQSSKTYNRITGYRLDELSLVDNPANPDCAVDLVKSIDGVATATDVLEKGELEKEYQSVDTDYKDFKDQPNRPGPGVKRSSARSFTTDSGHTIHHMNMGGGVAFMHAEDANGDVVASHGPEQVGEHETTASRAAQFANHVNEKFSGSHGGAQPGNQNAAGPHQHDGGGEMPAEPTEKSVDVAASPQVLDMLRKAYPMQYGTIERQLAAEGRLDAPSGTDVQKAADDDAVPTQAPAPGMDFADAAGLASLLQKCENRTVTRPGQQWIVKRATELGLTDQLPLEWGGTVAPVQSSAAVALQKGSDDLGELRTYFDARTGRARIPAPLTLQKSTPNDNMAETLHAMAVKMGHVCGAGTAGVAQSDATAQSAPPQNSGYGGAATLTASDDPDHSAVALAQRTTPATMSPLPTADVPMASGSEGRTVPLDRQGSDMPDPSTPHVIDEAYPAPSSDPKAAADSEMPKSPISAAGTTLSDASVGYKGPAGGSDYDGDDDKGLKILEQSVDGGLSDMQADVLLKNIQGTIEKAMASTANVSDLEKMTGVFDRALTGIRTDMAKVADAQGQLDARLAKLEKSAAPIEAPAVRDLPDGIRSVDKQIDTTPGNDAVDIERATLERVFSKANGPLKQAAGWELAQREAIDIFRKGPNLGASRRY